MKTLTLKLYSIILTVSLGYCVLSGFGLNKSSNSLKEITVERINIIDPDGKLNMVISNANRQHPGMFDGENLKQRERPAGIIFFNEEQDEVGGLIFHGNKIDGAGMALSLDQFKNDQVVQVQYERKADGKQQYGLNIWDRSETFSLPNLIITQDSLKQQGVSSEVLNDQLIAMNDGNAISAQRLFAGKNYKEQVGIFIKDEFGNPRIKIYLDKNNEPKFQILDENGEVSKEILE